MKCKISIEISLKKLWRYSCELNRLDKKVTVTTFVLFWCSEWKIEKLLMVQRKMGIDSWIYLVERKFKEREELIKINII